MINYNIHFSYNFNILLVLNGYILMKGIIYNLPYKNIYIYNQLVFLQICGVSF
jgi:hypothetical protein